MWTLKKDIAEGWTWLYSRGSTIFKNKCYNTKYVWRLDKQYIIEVYHINFHLFPYSKIPRTDARLWRTTQRAHAYNQTLFQTKGIDIAVRSTARRTYSDRTSLVKKEQTIRYVRALSNHWHPTPKITKTQYSFASSMDIQTHSAPKNTQNAHVEQLQESQ